MQEPHRSKSCLDFSGVCEGRAGCLVNLCCAPCVLPINAFRIYTWPCLTIIVSRLARSLCSCCLRCCPFRDKTFPPDATSLGNLKKALDDQPSWLRASQISSGAAAGRGVALIRDGITAADIAQGALGDCWLLSAFACLTEFPGTIENLFDTKEVNIRGRYSVRLFDGRSQKWVVVTVDDCFPCSAQGTPLFAQPKDNEIWALVLEKAVRPQLEHPISCIRHARPNHTHPIPPRPIGSYPHPDPSLHRFRPAPPQFAKFCGSYAALEGGLTLWALHAMTGDFVFSLSRQVRAT